MRNMKSWPLPLSLVRDETDSVYLSYLPFSGCPKKKKKKDPTELSPSQFLLSRTICLPPLCSSPWLALTHWSASGGRTEGLCYGFVRGDGKERRNEEGRDGKKGKGWSRRRGGTCNPNAKEKSQRWTELQPVIIIHCGVNLYMFICYLYLFFINIFKVGIKVCFSVDL